MTCSVFSFMSKKCSAVISQSRHAQTGKKNEEVLIYRGIKLPVEKNIIVLERRDLNICASEGRFRRLSYSLLHFKID